MRRVFAGVAIALTTLMACVVADTVMTDVDVAATLCRTLLAIADTESGGTT